MEIDKKVMRNLKKGLRIFLIITVISITVLLIFTVKKETFSSLKQIKPLFLGITLAICLCWIYLECLRLQTLGWAFGHWMSFRASAEFVLGGWFLTLTPFGVGGIPLQLYILRKEGFRIGEGGAILAMRGLVTAIPFIFAIPIVIGYRYLFASRGIRMLSGYLIAVVAVLFILGVLVLFRTERVKLRLGQLANFFNRKGWAKVASGTLKLSKELDKFKEGFKRCWSYGIYRLLLTIILSALALFSFVMLAPFLFRGLGVQAPIIKTAIIQLLLRILLLFSPTPGASGIAEGAAYALFRPVCPKQELIGIFVVLWRFFTYYIGVILGGIIILRMLAGGKTRTPTDRH